jgi:hypothetical protein
MHEPLQVSYLLQFDTGQPASCLFELGIAPQPQAEEPPSWARLDYKQCRNCPLKASEQTWCPFASEVARVLTPLVQHHSYDALTVTIHWRGRVIEQRSTLQRVLGSLIGFVGATCGCPRTRPFLPLAFVHQPFSEADETLFRVVGAYLIGQVLRANRGLSTDFMLSELPELYGHLRQVNLGMANRLRSLSDSDHGVNGVIVLDILASQKQDLFEALEANLLQYYGANLD